MLRELAVMGALLFGAGTGFSAHAQGPRLGTRSTMKNDVGIELLGKSVVYSFNYQRMMTTGVGLEVGLGALGGGGGAGADATIIFVPFGAKLYLIPHDGSLYLTGGGVLFTGTVDEGPFDRVTDIYAFAGLGFEFRSTGGFVFRGTAYSLVGGGEWFIWPGLTLGYAF
jgi:hypothetical protein